MHESVTDKAVFRQGRELADKAYATILPLSVRNLQYSVLGNRLVHVDSLDLCHGRPTIVMGPNGAGKSLLIRLLHGLIDPTGGEILYGGQTMTPDIRRRQAMVFQRPVILRRSVRANVEYAMAAHGIGGSERRKRVDELLQMGELAEKARQFARTLSSGEQQRLALLRAIAPFPDLLFLDEPTSSLDPSATQLIEPLICRAAERGTKIVMITHDVGQARRLAGEVVFMHRGKVTEQTSGPAFFESPTSEAARIFMTGQLLL